MTKEVEVEDGNEEKDYLKAIEINIILKDTIETGRKPGQHSRSKNKTKAPHRAPNNKQRIRRNGKQ